MIWPLTKKLSTQDLLHPAYDPERRRRVPFVAWLCLLALIVSGGVYLNNLSVQAKDQVQRAALMAENAKMRETLMQNTLTMQQNKATREELLRQISEQSVQLKKLQDDLAFFRRKGSK